MKLPAGVSQRLHGIPYEMEFPEFGPHDTAERARALRDDFGECWYLWYSDRWHTSPKTVFHWGYTAENATDLRAYLDSVMAAAIPELRAQLKAAEAASARLTGNVYERRREA